MDNLLEFLPGVTRQGHHPVGVKRGDEPLPFDPVAGDAAGEAFISFKRLIV